MDFFPPYFFEPLTVLMAVNLSLVWLLRSLVRRLCFCFRCDLTDAKPSRELVFRWEALICDQMDYGCIACFYAMLSVVVHIPYWKSTYAYSNTTQLLKDQ